MNLRLKLLVISVAPVFLVSVAAMLLINFQSAQLARVQGGAVEEMIRSSKEAELRNYIKLARTAVEPFYQWDNVSKIQAQKYVSDVFRQMTFGRDGFFFVYHADGTNLVQPRSPEMVGKNWIDSEDSSGRRVVRDLIDYGREGGQLYQYQALKPSTGIEAEKLGFSFYLDKWDWMIGSGLYLDDITAQIGNIRGKLEDNVKQTRWVLAGIAVSAVTLTALLFTIVQISEQRLADQRLKQLAARIVDTQENERKRVSTELHDGISQLLVSARYSLDLAAAKAAGDKTMADSIDKSAEAISTAISEIRRISMALRPSVLDDMGLAAALKSLCEDYQAQTGFTVHTEIEPVGSLLTDREKTTLYRICQEALTNVAKHSGANSVWVELRRTPRRVTLHIRDDGNGMQRAADRKGVTGLGMRNMQERVESHRGTFRVARGPEGGLALTATLRGTAQRNENVADEQRVAA